MKGASRSGLRRTQNAGTGEKGFNEGNKRTALQSDEVGSKEKLKLRRSRTSKQVGGQKKPRGDT